jgi:hypothetical protein
MAITRINDALSFTIGSCEVPGSGLSGFDAAPNRILVSGVGAWLYDGFPVNPFRYGTFRIQLAWQNHSTCDDVGLFLQNGNTGATNRINMPVFDGVIAKPSNSTIALASTTDLTAHTFYLFINERWITVNQGSVRIFSEAVPSNFFAAGEDVLYKIGFQSGYINSYASPGKYAFADKLYYKGLRL